MGIGIEVHEFEKEILAIERRQWPEIALCELGNQKIKFLKRRISAKKFYTRMGVREHVSLDLNRKNGARCVDLDRPVPDDLLERFDIVTDYGTLEHVNNQYQAFKNMHDLCRTGGLMLHSLPPPGHWPGHGRYYYPEQFFEELALLCGYTIIGSIRRKAREGRALHDMLLVAFRKGEATFPEKEQILLLPLDDSGDTSTTGNYTQRKKVSLMKRTIEKIKSRRKSAQDDQGMRSNNL